MVLFIDLNPLFFNIMGETSVLTLEPDYTYTDEVLDVPRALTVKSYSQVTGVYRRTDSIPNEQWELPLLLPVYTPLKTKNSLP